MRRLLLASAALLFQAVRAHARISVGIGIDMPGVSIGLDRPAYPELAGGPGYPDYRRRYAGDRYPRANEQQRSIRPGNYRHQPRDDATRQYLQPPDSRAQPARSDDNVRDARPPPHDKAHGTGDEDRGQDRQ